MEIRAAYHKQLRIIQDELLAIGSMAEKAILRSVDALKARDVMLAQKIIDDDKKIDGKRFEIEEKCVSLVATQQPMASDLRVIAAIPNLYGNRTYR